MIVKKYLGVWLDHSHAYLTDLKSDFTEASTIESDFTHESRENALGKSENLMHHKEQHEQLSYYHKLKEAIQGYDEVLLFGPTEAKSELHNLLLADYRFAQVNIHIKPADKMTNHKQHNFVREYFSTR